MLQTLQFAVYLDHLSELNLRSRVKKKERKNVQKRLFVVKISKVIEF